MKWVILMLVFAWHGVSKKQEVLQMYELELLCWKGYGEILSSFEEQIREICDARVCVYEKENADQIWSRYHEKDYDIVIADWEYQNHYRGRVLELPQWAWKGNQYLEPFQERGYWELDGRLSFVPVRFGTNGLIFRRGLGSGERSFAIRELLAPTKEGPCLRIGIWDWWLPNLLLLAKAAYPDRRPDTLTERELRSLRDGVIADYIAAVRAGWEARGVRRPVRFSNLGEIVRYAVHRQPEQRTAEWILGPSEMVVAPASQYAARTGAEARFAWQIPEEGGLVWVEAAAISTRLSDDVRRREAALEFINFLQSEDIQAALICGELRQAVAIGSAIPPEGHWSYALNNAPAIDRLPLDIRQAFENQPFIESVSAFSDWLTQQIDQRTLVFRRLPDDLQPWDDLWRKISIECGLRAA